MNIEVLGDMTLYGWVSSAWCCKGLWCPLLYIGVQRSFFLDCWTLKIKALWSSETSGNTCLMKRYHFLEHFNAAWVSEPQLPHHLILGGGRGEFAVICLAEYRLLLSSFQLPYQYQAVQMNTWHWPQHLVHVYFCFYIKWLCTCQSSYLSFW